MLESCFRALVSVAVKTAINSPNLNRSCPPLLPPKDKAICWRKRFHRRFLHATERSIWRRLSVTLVSENCVEKLKDTFCKGLFWGITLFTWYYFLWQEIQYIEIVAQWGSYLFIWCKTGVSQLAHRRALQKNSLSSLFTERYFYFLVKGVWIKHVDWERNLPREHLVSLRFMTWNPSHRVKHAVRVVSSWACCLAHKNWWWLSGLK